MVTLRVGWQSVPQALNPATDHPDKSDTVLGLIYDHLIYRTLDNAYLPALTDSWSSSDSGKTWVMTLHPGVTTHDGQALTAEDAAFTLHLFYNHCKFQYYGGYTATIQSVQASGAQALTVVMSQPVGNIETYLAWMPVLPKVVYESGEFDAGQRIGSGPFTLHEFVPGERIVLQANRAYWLGPPKIDQIIFQNYATADDLAAALKAGDVDVITDVPPRLIASLKSDSQVQVLTGPQIHLRSLLLNVSTKTESTGHPALRDQRVRLAIAQAIDKQQLLDVALLGRAMPGLSVLPPVLGKWFNTELKDTAFDLSAAAQTLENAGYKDTNADGVREMPGGSQKLTLRLFVSSDSPTTNQEAGMIANWLRQVGIQVSVKTLAPAALAATCCPAFDYDLALADQDSGADPGYLLGALTTSEIDSGLNQTGYSNPTYDALYTQQANTLDQESRRALVWQLQQIVMDERPCIPLYYDLAVQAFRKDRFRNWLFVPNGVLSLLDARSLLQVETVPQ